MGAGLRPPAPLRRVLARRWLREGQGCVMYRVGGGPAGDLAATADPPHTHGITRADGACGLRPWLQGRDGCGVLAERQPTGPQGGTKASVLGPGVGVA